MTAPLRTVPLPSRRRDVQAWQIEFWAAKRREAERLAMIYGPDNIA